MSKNFFNMLFNNRTGEYVRDTAYRPVAHSFPKENIYFKEIIGTERDFYSL